MNRVVITGQGIVSALGHSVPSVLQALQAGQSAIAFQPSYAEAGMRSQIAALPNLAELPHIDRKLRRYMSEPAQFAWHAAQAAIAESGLTSEQIAAPTTGVILGEGVGSILSTANASSQRSSSLRTSTLSIRIATQSDRRGAFLGRIGRGTPSGAKQRSATVEPPFQPVVAAGFSARG